MGRGMPADTPESRAAELQRLDLLMASEGGDAEKDGDDDY